jgi:hypothetical protein
MKRKLPDSTYQNTTTPSKKLKVITNDQKIKDLQSDFKSKSSQFDNQIHELEQKIASLKKDQKDFSKLYYLDKLLNNYIDYIFLKDDNNVDRTKFKVTKIYYCIEYRAYFIGESINNIQNGELEDYKIEEFQLDQEEEEQHKDILKHIDIDDYDELLAVAAFGKEDFSEDIIDDASTKKSCDVDLEDFHSCGSGKICGKIYRYYYFVQRKV